MNVQTLPPGYKTAPWNPPEKIDGKMLSEASSRLIELLRIRTQPIGMKLYEDPKDMEKIQGLRRPTEGFKFTMCQMVTQSRWYGFTLGIEVDNTRGGNCGGVVGLNYPGENYFSGDNMNGVWFGNKEAAAAHQAQMPRVPHGKYNGLVVAPLRSARLDPPDICMFYGTPGQMIYFINGLQYHRYRRYDFTVTGESACADSWGRALATRQTSLSLPCFAERRYGGVADDELLMACPPDEMLRAIEGMTQLGKNGLRYPFPPYGAVMDPALGMAKSYRLSMLYVVGWPVLSDADDTVLRRLRAQYHPAEAGMIGPHFTLVFGAPDEHEAPLRAALGSVSRRPFWFMIDRIARHDLYLYAEPSDGAAELIELYETLNPEGGAEPFEPHITLGLFRTPMEAEQVARIVGRQHLPIRGRVEELALLKRNGAQLDTIATVPLAG